MFERNKSATCHYWYILIFHIFASQDQINWSHFLDFNVGFILSKKFYNYERIFSPCIISTTSFSSLLFATFIRDLHSREEQPIGMPCILDNRSEIYYLSQIYCGFMRRSTCITALSCFAMANCDLSLYICLVLHVFYSRDSIFNEFVGYFSAEGLMFGLFDFMLLADQCFSF